LAINAVTDVTAFPTSYIFYSPKWAVWQKESVFDLWLKRRKQKQTPKKLWTGGAAGLKSTWFSACNQQEKILWN
jgi:hypothetical protein